MLRNLTRRFDCALRLQRQTYPHAVRLLQTTDVSRALFTQYACESRLNKKQPTLVTAAAGIRNHATPTASEADNEYVPYRTELESGSHASALIAAIRERFRLTEGEAQRILSDEQVRRSYRNRCLTNALDRLLLEGVSKKSFLEYPWLLVLDRRTNESIISIPSKL